MSAVTTDIGLLHSQLPELSLRDLAAAATEQAVQGHMNAAFAALQERLNSGVNMLCQQLSTQQPGELPGAATMQVCARMQAIIQVNTLHTIKASADPNMFVWCAGLDLQAQVQPLLPAYNYLCDVVQKGTAALLKVRSMCNL